MRPSRPCPSPAATETTDLDAHEMVHRAKEIAPDPGVTSSGYGSCSQGADADNAAALGKVVDLEKHRGPGNGESLGDDGMEAPEYSE